MKEPDCYLNALGVLCAAGTGAAELAAASLAGASPGMRATAAYSLDGLSRVLGAVDAALPALPASTPLRQASRNNQLALAALEQIRPAVEAALKRWGPGRLGVVVGTTTSGISEGEDAIAAWASSGRLPPRHHYGQIEIGSPAEFLSDHLGLRGPSMVVSTACSSSAKALGMARRLLRLGVCDAVLAGGVDTLCRYTVAGFKALGAVSDELCLPFSRHRHGINIGEAAALFLVTREKGGAALLGCGESSDAFNISAPHPEGAGAEAAMRQALADAGLESGAIDYVNLHGTATDQNDSTEARAMGRVFAVQPLASSTKPLTGHALGAAGAIEAALCWLALRSGNAQGLVPPHLYDGQADPALPALHLAKKGEGLGRPLTAVMSSSFGFGGSNAALVLGAA